MDARLSITVTILASLLTGGFIMLFIESQQIGRSVTERFNFIMSPFIHSFSNYLKFVSFYSSAYLFKAPNDNYINKLQNLIKDITRLAHTPIMTGQNYPSDYFKADELNTICEKINNIWYYFDRQHNHVYNNLDVDSNAIEHFEENIKSYLEEISSRYKNVLLNKYLLSKVSGEFYTDFYQPVKHICYEYEFWKKKENSFKILIIVTVSFTLLTMILILLLYSNLPIIVYNGLCTICCILLAITIFKLIKIENLSEKILR